MQKRTASVRFLLTSFANRMGVNVDKNPVKTQKSTPQGVLVVYVEQSCFF